MAASPSRLPNLRLSPDLSAGSHPATGSHSAYKRFGGDSHPKHYNRLIQVLEPYAHPEHRVWQFIALAVKLHLDDAGIKVETPAEGHADAKAAVEAYALRLGELERAWDEEERRRTGERR